MPSSATSEAFVDDVAAAFRRAADRGCEVRSLTLARRRVRVLSAGTGLAETYLSALAHLGLPIPPSTSGSGRCTDDADLTVHLWERSTSGVAAPSPPWSPDDFLAGGRIRGHGRDRIRVTYAEWARTLTVYDAGRRRAFLHLRDRRDVPPWVLRAPLRNVFTWWASDRGLALLHAAAVGDGRRAVVLAGPSGSGKSTTALACLADGLRWLGDDACIVELSDAPEVFPVYRFAKLERDALARMPELEGYVVDPSADQLLVEPPGVPASGMPLHAVLLPSIVPGAETRVGAVSARDALHTLVPANLMEGEGAGGTTLGALHATRAVRGMPPHRAGIQPHRRGRGGAACPGGGMSDRALAPGDLVAVIVPVRDCERYVNEAVDSLLAQTAPPREIVVIDDGSSDGTPDALARYGDPVRVVRQEPVGQFAAINHGIEVSTAPVLAFLDADDLYPPDSLAVRLARLLADDAPEAVFGRIIQFVSPELGPEASTRFRFDPEPPHAELFQAQLIRRAAFERVGPLRTDWATSANLEWTSRARGAGLRSVIVPDVVARRRLHGKNVGITRAAQKNLDLLRMVRQHRHRIEAAESESPGTESPSPRGHGP